MAHPIVEMYEEGLRGCASIMFWACAVLIVVCTAAWFAIVRSPPFGAYQTQDQVEARYTSCKSKAKEGFDCVMIPMLVTEEFMRETYAREAHTETSR